MINYSFCCGAGHEFSVYFKNGDSCDKQLKKGLVECPYCGDSKVQKLLSAPNVAAKNNSKKVVKDFSTEPTDKELRAAWKKLYSHIKNDFDNVGDEFPDEARKIHYGEAEHRNIYGKADYKEVKALHKEGVKILPLPMIDEKKKN